MSECQLLSTIHITSESHPHEADYFGFVTEKNEVVGPVVEQGKRYAIHHQHPVLYIRNDGSTIHVVGVVGTLSKIGVFSDATVTFCDPFDPSRISVASRTEFPFVLYKGDTLEEIRKDPLQQQELER